MRFFLTGDDHYGAETDPSSDDQMAGRAELIRMRQEKEARGMEIRACPASVFSEDWTILQGILPHFCFLCYSVSQQEMLQGIGKTRF